jgi:amidase
MRATYRHRVNKYRRVVLFVAAVAAVMRFGGPDLANLVVGGIDLEAADTAGSTVRRGKPPAVFRLEEATIADIKAALDAGALTCEQLARMYLARIAEYDEGDPFAVPPDKINSIITVNPRALRTAAALDRQRRFGGRQSALHCIPVLLKDNIDTFDMPTSNGSVILKDAIPPDDAYITDALRDAGALILGKAAMGEFAGGSYNTVSGQTINPYNFKRQTGGSSSGSGAAVAANFAVLAVGTDTSTSVRGPAAFNGIVGLRPTTGLISRGGIAPKNLTFDSAGPMARTVTDMAILLSAIAGPDPEDSLSIEIWEEVSKRYRRFLERKPGGHTKGGKPRVGVDYTRFLKKGSLKGARIGVARDYFGGDPVIDALAEEAIAKLRVLGAEIIDPVVFDRAFINNFVFDGTTYGVRDVADYRFKEDWEAYLATFGPDVPKTVAEFVEFYDTTVLPFPVENSVHNGLLRESLDHSSAEPLFRYLVDTVLPENTARKLAIFDSNDLDALVFPYNASFAGPISNPLYAIADPTHVGSGGRPSPSTFAGYSSIGFPGIVVPMGFGPQGLPMTISFMGRPYDEGKLIGYAYDYEQATHLRRPSPLVPPLRGEVVKYYPGRKH